MSTANVTCAKVRAAPSKLYTTFNPRLGIQSVVILRIMPALPLPLSLQQNVTLGDWHRDPPLLLLLGKMPALVEKVQNWLSSGEQQVFVIGMYLREKPKNLGYIYIQRWVIRLQTVLHPSQRDFGRCYLQHHQSKVISRTRESALDILTIFWYCFTSIRI